MADARTIVITGATRGLGRALTEGFVAAGHTVAGCGRDAERISELSRQFPAPHLFAAVDVTDGDRVRAWAGEVMAAIGAPDLLINNAALMNRPAPLWEVPADEFAQMTDVNINGVHRVIRAFVPAMIARGRGVIVNLSSGWGRSTAPEVGPYCTTKWAVEGMTGALAQELPAGLAAVALNPGIIDTDMLRTCWSGAAGQYESPDTWAARAVPFLLDLSPADNGKPLTAP